MKYRNEASSLFLLSDGQDNEPGAIDRLKFILFYFICIFWDDRALQDSIIVHRQSYCKNREAADMNSLLC